MSYLQKIYFDNKSIIFSDSIINYISHHKEAVNYPRYIGATTANILSAQVQLANDDCSGILFEEADRKVLNASLSAVFIPVTAAGGVVSTPEGKILMIYRRGVWDLPKGKLDEGESIPECAIREVVEETGLPNAVSLGNEIHRSYHVYSFKGENILKTTYWFAMKVAKEWPLQPQTEEDITEAIWMEKDKLPEVLQNSWPTIREVLLKAEGGDQLSV